MSLRCHHGAEVSLRAYAVGVPTLAQARRHSLLLCAGLLPLAYGVYRASKTDAASKRALRLHRRERARSPVRRRGRHWEVTSNQNVVVVVTR